MAALSTLCCPERAARRAPSRGRRWHGDRAASPLRRRWERLMPRNEIQQLLSLTRRAVIQNAQYTVSSTVAARTRPLPASSSPGLALFPRRRTVGVGRDGGGHG